MTDRSQNHSCQPWGEGKGWAQLDPADPVSYPPEGAASRMGGSRVLTQQWRGSSAAFGRSQTMLSDDLAAGHGKFQNLSKSHLGCVLEPELLSHGFLVSKASL